MIIDRKKNKLFSIVGSWGVAIKRSSPVLHKMIYNVHMHFLRGLRDLGLGQTSNTFKIGATKSQLHSNVVANVAPVSILFHQLHFIKTRE